MSKYTRYIETIVDDIGCPRHLKGYNTLIEAVENYLTNPDLRVMDNYAMVGSMFGKTAAQVERNIRHIIRYTLSRCDYSCLKKYFANSIPDDYDITNKHFIATVAVSAKRMTKIEEVGTNVDNEG